MWYLGAAGLIVLGYLIGSIPVGYIVVKAMSGKDIRTEGSKNVGTTNTLRLVGKFGAVLVFVADIAKGALPTLLGKLYVMNTVDFDNWVILAMLCGVAAWVGHIFPLYLRFVGGKGAATGLGIAFAVSPIPALVGAAVWLVTLYVSRYGSLATIVTCLFIGIWLIFDTPHLLYTLFIWFLIAFILYKHRANIKRLLNGTENKIGNLK
ncbi:MAG: glycerol-3-phosphate 1-O-acyltransferase PlsY [Clostridiales bacterium]|nr:glycerol-3-phosphate 1-O-acyltransferase PlsY [Clostridiales bacterium]